MDDYILRVLFRQTAHEEAAAEALQEKQRYMSREVPEGTENRENPAQSRNDRTERTTTGEAGLWAMLKNMEPLSLAVFTDREAGADGGENARYIPDSLSRLSGVVFGQKARQLTPEGLSLFYQRDARRFS